MKIKNKFKLNKSFIAAMEVMIDNEADKSKEKYYKNGLNFIISIKEYEYNVLSTKQKSYLVSFIQELRKNGFSI